MAITMTLKRAAEESGLSIRTIYSKIGSGELMSAKIGRRRLIPARALEQFLLGSAKPQSTKQHGRGIEVDRPTPETRALADEVRHGR